MATVAAQVGSAALRSYVIPAARWLWQAGKVGLTPKGAVGGVMVGAATAPAVDYVAGKLGAGDAAAAEGVTATAPPPMESDGSDDLDIQALPRGNMRVSFKKNSPHAKDLDAHLGLFGLPADDGDKRSYTLTAAQYQRLQGG